MQMRKLQEMGGATLLVSLPKEWVRKTSLKKGSVVTIDESADGGLFIYPPNVGNEDRVGREVNIVYPSKYSNEGLPNEITAVYLLGYDLIRVSGARGDLFQRPEQIISTNKPAHRSRSSRRGREKHHKSISGGQNGRGTK